MLSNGMIADGEFDRYLLRPVHPLFHLCAERIQNDGLGELITGIALACYAGVRLGLALSFLDCALLIASVFLGAVICMSVKLFFASISFWTKRSIPLLNMIYSFSNFGKYPVEIFSNGIRFLASYAIPFAFTAFYPASYFLGRNTFTQALLPQAAIAAISFALAYELFTLGTRAYESSGT
jgi:ABC-2 type transport system permease protein